MNKRYIDFVPSKKGAGPQRTPSRPKVTVEKSPSVTERPTEAENVVVDRNAPEVTEAKPETVELEAAVIEVETAKKPRPAVKRPVQRPVGQRVVSDMVRRPRKKVAPGVATGVAAMPRAQRAPEVELAPDRQEILGTEAAARWAQGVEPKRTSGVANAPRVRRVTQIQQSVAVQEAAPSLEETFLEEDWLENPLLDDPLERPVSEFTDLEELAQEIAEVTQNEPVLDAEEIGGGEAFSLRQEPQYGVVENYQPRFLQTEVEKRPLSPGYAAAEVVSVGEGPMTEAAAKAQKRNPFQRATGVGQINTARKMANARGATRSTQSANLTNAANYGVNGGLGGNLAGSGTIASVKTAPGKASRAAKMSKASKTAEAPKSKKGSKIAMVFAVIGTIILGAAVGTVAFLILPR